VGSRRAVDHPLRRGQSAQELEDFRLPACEIAHRPNAVRPYSRRTADLRDAGPRCQGKAVAERQRIDLKRKAQSARRPRRYNRIQESGVRSQDSGVRSQE
jgi:hypothetical protein